MLLEHGFYLKKPKLGPDLHTPRKACGRDWSFRFDAFVRENVTLLYKTLWRRNDIRKFDADAILFWEINCKKTNIKCLSDVFSAVCVIYARITVTHICFIAWTLAGSLGRCLNSRPNGLVFKQLPRDPANVHAWKKTYVIPIVVYRFSGNIMTSITTLLT